MRNIKSIGKIKEYLKEYGPVIAGYALSLSPYTRASLSVGSYLEGRLGGRRGIAAKYASIEIGVIATAAADTSCIIWNTCITFT
ncbi:hypothetical protein [Candidatus Nanopusillus massiliensis]|uniref:hypothetical protein n=1 Tax=Candidatus Nanopusillus massiliensis TaxID=2897163 RepID=UPI001E4E16C7|nr:hypothetical protein [Candidatus Nanopusillus massiliensis]